MNDAVIGIDQYPKKTRVGGRLYLPDQLCDQPDRQKPVHSHLSRCRHH